MFPNQTEKIFDNSTDYNDVNHANQPNGTTSDNITWKESDIIFISAFVAIFIIGVGGNLLVCHIFNTRKKKLSTMEKLIFRLGVVDLFASLLNPFLFIYWQITHNKVWNFGAVGCKILPSLNYFTDSLSIGIIILIAIDRGRKICQPMLPPYTMRQINRGFLLIICGGVVMEIPRLIHAQVVPGYSCTVFNSRLATFAYPTLSLLILRDLVSTIIFAIVFYEMHKVLYSTKSNGILGNDKNKKRRKAYILLVAMTVVFILLVYPRDFLHIIYISLNLAPINYKPPHMVVHVNTLLKIMRASNSIVNVFIYAGFHSGFRRRLKRLPSVMVRKKVYRVPYKDDNLIQSDRSMISVSAEKAGAKLSRYAIKNGRLSTKSQGRKPRMSVPLFV